MSFYMIKKGNVLRKISERASYSLQRNNSKGDLLLSKKSHNAHTCCWSLHNLQFMVFWICMFLKDCTTHNVLQNIISKELILSKSKIPKSMQHPESLTICWTKTVWESFCLVMKVLTSYITSVFMGMSVESMVMYSDNLWLQSPMRRGTIIYIALSHNFVLFLKPFQIGDLMEPGHWSRLCSPALIFVVISPVGLLFFSNVVRIQVFDSENDLLNSIIDLGTYSPILITELQELLSFI